MRLPPTLAGALALLSVVTACGSGSGSSGACGPITREALDPNYLVHVLGGDDVDYESDPPTSGPHQPTPPVEGVVDEPLPRPIQVGILERGDVLLQHRPDLPAGQLTELQALAGPGVVIAPNTGLDDPVIATGWLSKRTCDAVDIPALEDFVAERIGKGPEG